MKFEEVLPHLRNGNFIYKKNWKDKDFYLSLKDKKSNDSAILSLNEIVGDDWEIRDDKKYMSFGKAFELMKKGHKIKHKLWGASYLYIDNKNNILKIKGYCTTPVKINSFGRYIFSLDEEDVLDNNWYVIE